MNSKKLSLKARDIENSDIISSLLQDSILHVSSLSFHEDKKCFRLMLNRFCWENIDKNIDNKNSLFRVHSGLYVHHVKNVFLKNIKKDNSMKFLNLLSMHVYDNEINILFSNYVSIILEIDEIYIHLKDLHDKYPTDIMPLHSI